MGDDEGIDMVSIPPAFWAGLAAGELGAIVTRGTLDAEQCARVWRLTDRQGPPPRSLTVLVKREDILRLFPPPPPRR